MKRAFVALAAALSLLGSVVPGAGAQAPSEGGLSTDNVEWITHVPFEVGTATGARVIGKHLYVTTWRSFSIYDVSKPEAPEHLSTTPFLGSTGQPSPIKFENEDVATNGEILIFSEELPQAALHVWNVEDKTAPVQIASLPGAGEHTMSCILDCKWLYGSDGGIIDLRKPTEPKLMKEKWGDDMPAGNSGHDVTEVAPGLVLTSTNPMMFLDARKDPRNPKLLAISEQMSGFVHSNQWPDNAKDRFALSTGETWVPGADARCTDNSAGFSVHDTKGWKDTGNFKLVDTFKMTNGTYVDGSPVINAPFGCSSHWFQQHPTFEDGGLVAAGFYNHGTRFLDISSKGKITEVGWFLPNGGGTSAAYWLTDRIVYAVDYQRGIDVLKFNGKL